MKQHIIYIFLGLIIILLYFSRLFVPEPQLFSTPDFGHSDLWHFNIPMRKIYWEALQKNTLPFIDQRIGNGFAVFAENQIGALNLQNLIIFKFFPFVTAFNLSYVFIFLTVFIGNYLLFIEFRVDEFLSFLGSLIFTFSGFFIAQITHPNLIHSAAYFPLLFFLLEKWTKSVQNMFQRRFKLWYILFIFFQTQCFLAGFPQFFLIINFFFFLYLFFLRRGRSATLPGFPAFGWVGRVTNPPLREKLKQKIIAALSNNLIIYIYTIIVTLILCLPQIIPSLEFTKAAGRSRGISLDALAAFPYNPKHLLSFFNPYIFGNPKYATYPAFNQDWGIFWESTFYVGSVIFITYLIAIIFNYFGRGFPRKTPTVLSSHKTKSIFKIGLISLLLGFGKYTPLFLIIQLPPFNLFRTPARFMFLFMFSVIFVAIIFLDRIIRSFCRSHSLRMTMIKITIFVIIIPELLFQFWSYHLILPARAVLASPKIVKHLKPNDVIFSYNPHENWNQVFLKKGWGDEKEIKEYLFLKNSLDQNLNVLWNVKNINVYAGSIPKSNILIEQELINLINTKVKNITISLNNKTVNRFNELKIDIVISPLRMQNDRIRQITREQDGNLTIYVYRIKSVN